MKTRLQTALYWLIAHTSRRAAGILIAVGLVVWVVMLLFGAWLLFNLSVRTIGKDATLALVVLLTGGPLFVWTCYMTVVQEWLPERKSTDDDSYDPYPTPDPDDFSHWGL